MKFIDAHVHFYDANLPEGLVWPEKDSGYHETALPKNLIDDVTTAPCSVIAIETSIRECDDNWLIELANQSPIIGAVILNLGINSAAFGKRLETARNCRKFRGCRLRPIDDFDLSKPDLEDKILCLPKQAPVVELGCPNNQIADQIVDLANKLSCKTFVVDHFGHPNIKYREQDKSWEKRIAKLAECQNIHCKITALTQFSSHQKTDYQDYFRVLNFIEKNFGSKRIIYGSNWPPVQVTGGHNQNIRILKSYFGEKTRAIEQFFWRNASRIYLQKSKIT